MRTIEPRPATIDLFDAFERSGWSRGRAAPYHRGLGPLTSHAVAALLDAARVRPGSAVLDVACGPGYGAALAAERGAEAVGVDVSAEMVDLAAGLHPAVRFGVAEAGTLPFADATFDAVVAGFLMPHVADLPAVVTELARVLRPGGRLALSTWDRDAPGFLPALLQAVAAAGAVPPAELPAGPDFFQYAADDAFAALLMRAGLERPTVEAVAYTHRTTDLDAFLAGVVDGTVRTNALIAGQSPEVRARIRHGFAERVAAWRVDGGYALPFVVKIGAAAKPPAV